MKDLTGSMLYDSYTGRIGMVLGQKFYNGIRGDFDDWKVEWYTPEGQHPRAAAVVFSRKSLKILILDYERLKKNI